jgi:hypothetical protein
LLAFKTSRKISLPLPIFPFREILIIFWRMHLVSSGPCRIIDLLINSYSKHLGP